MHCLLARVYSSPYRKWKNSVGLSRSCLSIPEFLLLREWKPSNCYSSAACLLQTGVWKAEEGYLGLCVCVGAEAKEEGVWSGVLMNRRTGLLLCSPNSQSFPSCFALPLTKLFMAFWFGARSLAHLPTCVWVCVWVKILTIDILLVVQFYFKQHAKLSLTFLACEKF